jgi:zinc transport system substrate-binding protein
MVGCGQAVKDETKPMVTVSILPQEYFVRRIVGDDYRINVMIPPGHSPAAYEPSPREMKAVSESVFYFRIGHIVFEKAWMDKIASLNKKMKIVDTSVGVSLITGMPHHDHGEPEEADHHEHEHEHEHEHKHEHGGIDPHIWLSPAAVKIQIKHILDAFVEADSGSREVYEVNYRRFIEDIEKLQTENETVLLSLKGKKFMVYHPAWSYFARDYGLIQYPIEIEGKSPSAANLKKLIDLAKGENIRVIFVQQQFDSNSARAVADEIGGKVIAMDPLAGDWLANMKKIAGTFKEALASTEEK